MNNIEDTKIKCYNVGFMIGLIPYLILMMLTNNQELRKELLFFGILTGIINGLILKKRLLKHKKISD